MFSILYFLDNLDFINNGIDTRVSNDLVAFFDSSINAHTLAEEKVSVVKMVHTLCLNLDDKVITNTHKNKKSLYSDFSCPYLRAFMLNLFGKVVAAKEDKEAKVFEVLREVRDNIDMYSDFSTLYTKLTGSIVPRYMTNVFTIEDEYMYLYAGEEKLFDKKERITNWFIEFYENYRSSSLPIETYVKGQERIEFDEETLISAFEDVENSNSYVCAFSYIFKKKSSNFENYIGYAGKEYNLTSDDSYEVEDDDIAQMFRALS